MSTGGTGGGQPQNQRRQPEQNPPAAQQPPEQPQRRSPPPFTVEFGDNFLSNHTINTPPFQMVVRGAFALSKLSRRERDGKKYGAREVGTAAGRIPDLPGAMLEINCRTKKVRLFDPLDSPEGKEILANYNAVANAPTSQALLPKNLGPFKTVEHTLTDDQLKTLVLEIGRKLESRSCTVVEGTFPSAHDIDAMPGLELYDPQNNNSMKPYYKKDHEAWLHQMRMTGAV